MKKIIAILVILFATAGCKQLMHGEMQPVKEINFKEKIYSTTCSGAVEDMGACDSKARDTCKGEYTVMRRFETIAHGARRELTFQCKK